MSVPGAGTNKAVVRLRGLGRLLHMSPGDRLSLLSNCHSFYLHFGTERKHRGRSKQTVLMAVVVGGGGLGFSFNMWWSNVMTLTPRDGAARPGRAPKVWSGSAAVPGSLLSKWSKSCQLSKSV